MKSQNFNQTMNLYSLQKMEIWIIKSNNRNFNMSFKVTLQHWTSSGKDLYATVDLPAYVFHVASYAYTVII